MGLADAMAAPELFLPPIPYYHVAIPVPRIAEHMIIRIHRNQVTKKESLGSVIIQRSSGFSRPIHGTRAALQRSGVEETEKEPPRDKKASESDGSASPTQIKLKLHQALQGINRGIFGVPSEKKSEIEALVGLLEAQNPTPAPTSNLEKVDGCWKLVFSTVTILGGKRTKLGLRDFITLGDFLQIINVSERKAVNVIKFNVRGLNVLNGQLTIEATFKVASKSRVDIAYKTSTITPEQLMNMFRKNYDLLLSIFNPQGWLVISYVDDTLRIGRDDKGNIFLLERS